MAMLACPFCYKRIDGKNLWFRCAGRGSPGKKACTARADPDRARETGVTENVLPSFEFRSRGLRAANAAICPDCGGETGVKVCPRCHTKLPPTFGTTSSPLIAMVGAKGTGKSVYLKVLTHQLRKELGQRFDADVRLVGDSQFQGGADFLDPAGDLFPDRSLYAETSHARGGRREPIVFGWRQRRQLPGFSRYSTTYLSFYDTAGEDLNTDTGVENLQYLGAADALILLLDPFQIPRARDQIRVPESAVKNRTATVDVLGRVTDNLRSSHGLGDRKNIPIPVAVAFAKMDAFFDVLGPNHPLVRRPLPQPVYDEIAGRETHEYVRAQLREWGAGDIDQHLTMSYKNYRYFAVSALGAEPDYEEGLVDDHGVHPFRVDEPLLWLLSRFGVVPSGGGPR